MASPSTVTLELTRTRPRLGGFSSRRAAWLMAAYLLLVALCVGSLIRADDFSFGRKPWRNLVTTAGELSQPSFLNLWFGDAHLEYKSDDGRVLRVEDQRAVEAKFLQGLGVAVWTTLKIATLGSLLAALLGAPLGFLSAKNMHAPSPVAWIARALLDVARSIHTLVFGLLIVGIVGLGPMAGILAIALHSMGTWGKLYAESIETLDMRPIEAVRATGASPTQVFLFAVWPALLPNFLSNHLYIWEYNSRDSTVLGLIGAGGLGLLVSEAVSLFQWGRLATILLVIVLLVVAFDALSRKIRAAVL